MKTARATKVIVGLSGGVDSSVAALLLIQQGYQVEGLFMKNWDEDDGTDYCTAMVDLEEATRVAEHLGIKLHQANFAAEYWDNVFSHFLEEYQAGRTPNPDILCNREIKFKVFIEYADLLGADMIATGHYARVIHEQNHSHLLKGLDNNKDQSYFLHAVPEIQLARALFPLGEYQKSDVRKLAKDAGLPNFARKDSTGICFIGERRFKDFLENYLPAKPGDIVTSTGDIIGRHDGLMYHTIGQRQGLRIGGLKNYPEEPWYVLGKDLDRNELIAGQGNENPAMFSDSLMLNNISWIDTKGPELPFQGTAKIRYRQADQHCELRQLEQGYEVFFKQPQRAVTPGQYACFYSRDRCLGGGIIEAGKPGDIA